MYSTWYGCETFARDMRDVIKKDVACMLNRAAADDILRAICMQWMYSMFECVGPLSTFAEQVNKSWSHGFVAETADKGSCKREPRQSKGVPLSSVLYVWVYPVIRDATWGKIRYPATGGREICVTSDR